MTQKQRTEKNNVVPTQHSHTAFSYLDVTQGCGTMNLMAVVRARFLVHFWHTRCVFNGQLYLYEGKIAKPDQNELLFAIRADINNAK